MTAPSGHVEGSGFEPEAQVLIERGAQVCLTLGLLQRC